VAIELICAAQGLDFRKPLRPGRGVVAAHEAVRGLVPTLAADRPPAPDIEAVAVALREGLLDALAPDVDEIGARRPAARATPANGHRRPSGGPAGAGAGRNGSRH
jgi:hypothetical protein